MKSTGEKIRFLRSILGLTQRELADYLDVVPKSIQRYEADTSVPDSTALASLSSFFNVPSDYFLGTMSFSEQKKLESKISLSDNLYRLHVKARENKIEESAEYFGVEIDPSDIGGGLSYSSGFAGYDEKGRELWVARPVIGENYIRVINSLGFPVLVINDKLEVLSLEIFGGHAIIKEDVFEYFFSSRLQPMPK